MMQIENTLFSDELQSVPFRLRPFTVKEFCNFYGTTYKTFHRWLLPYLEEIGARNGRYYSIRQVRIIMDRLGTP